MMFLPGVQMPYRRVASRVWILAMAWGPSAAAQALAKSRPAESGLQDPFRSPQQEAAAPVKAVPPPPVPALVATSLLIAGRSSTATLRGTHRLLVIGIGDWVDGWQVIAVTENGVTLQISQASHSVMAHLPVERYWRLKEATAGNSTASNKTDDASASSLGAALPGGDVPLLPQSTVPELHPRSVPPPVGQARQDGPPPQSPPYPIPSGIPRLPSTP